MSTRSGLGPHCVGQRVVVRRLVHGERGPTGGPAMTDLLGVMESWSDRVTTVRDDAGALTTIAVADIVTGKPVPPRPSMRLRVSAEDAERRAVAAWPPVQSRPLGEWLLRAAGGFSTRANSVLAAGDPDRPFPDALAEVAAFYADHALPVQAQLVVDSPTHDRFEDAGWVPARPDEADTLFSLASVAAVLRTVRRRGPSVVPEVRVSTTAGPDWLANDTRAGAHPQAASAVLEGPERVGFAAVHEDGRVIAKGRVACGRDDDWAGITDVWVDPGQRRRGLAVAVLGRLLEWAAEQGATTAYLQVRGDNDPALALYDRLGFAVHHAYRYLMPPA